MDKQTREQMARDNYNVINAVYDKYFARYPSRYRDDFVSAGGWALTRAIDTYQTSRGPFWSYAFGCVKNKMVEVARQILRNRRLSANLVVDVAVSSHHEADVDNRDLVAHLMGKIPTEISELIYLKEGEGLSYREINEKKSYPQSTISLRIWQGIRQIQQQC